MNPRWQYLDPPASADGARLYDRDEVLEAERWAWAGDGRGRRAEFFYDGFDFWRQLRSGERQAVSRARCPRARLVARAGLQLPALRRAPLDDALAGAGRAGTLVILRRQASVGRRVSGTAAVSKYAEGRVCALHGCATVLSVYNGSRFCALHERARTVRSRCALRPPAERTCPNCGVAFESANERRRYCSDRCRMAAFARRKRAAARQEAGATPGRTRPDMREAAWPRGAGSRRRVPESRPPGASPA